MTDWTSFTGWLPRIRQHIDSRKAYFFFLGILLICGTIFVLVEGKAESFLCLNRFHANWADRFFIAYTYLGDGLFSLVIFGFLMAFRRSSVAWKVMLAFLSSGVVAQVIKNLVESPRPGAFFTQEQYSHFIEGVTLHGLNSFPSGHTTSAFALATILALSDNKIWRGLLYLLVATAVAYSRIYLGQHFLADVLAGALLGAIFALITQDLLRKGFRIRRRQVVPPDLSFSGLP